MWGDERNSSKNQVTVTVDALRDAGLEPGERVTAVVDGPGPVVLEHQRGYTMIDWQFPLPHLLSV